jgi:AbrB family looped-hinge helix DNA binding protein
MRTTMDGGGRVVIPKDVRTRLGWGPGQEFEIFEVDGQLVLEPPTVPMRAELRGATTVAVTDEPMPPLSSATVRDALEQIRR